MRRTVDPDLDEDNFADDERDWLTCETRGVGTRLAQSYRSLAYGIFVTPARLRPAKGHAFALQL